MKSAWAGAGKLVSCADRFGIRRRQTAIQAGLMAINRYGHLKLAYGRFCNCDPFPRQDAASCKVLQALSLWCWGRRRRNWNARPGNRWIGSPGGVRKSHSCFHGNRDKPIALDARWSAKESRCDCMGEIIVLYWYKLPR